MNKITIEVESDIQEAFEKASESEKQEIKSLIAINKLTLLLLI